jgi:hypothetical protein
MDVVERREGNKGHDEDVEKLGWPRKKTMEMVPAVSMKFF